MGVLRSGEVDKQRSLWSGEVDKQRSLWSGLGVLRSREVDK